MTQPATCLECGANLPANSPEGLCRACLFKRGLETNTVGYTQPPESARWTPPTVEELAAGFPELEIQRLIGRGGMGAVYQARQKSLDRTVALKILPPAMASEAAFAERFAREAQAMAKLNHPHIVTLYEFGHLGARASSPALPPGPSSPDLYYFLMEYVDGVSLRGLLDTGHVSPKEALAIVPQICEALQYAHDQGIVHRDIKPENILLNKQGQVKIADFGLAKLIGRTSAVAERAMGTPQYMAPEQKLRTAEVDHRADIYALGVVFYQMLTGELPKGAFVPPSRRVQIDVRLDEIVMRALETEPNRRYQHASEVKTQVETIVGESRQTSAPRQPLSPLRGAALVFAAIAILSVVVGGLCVIGDITPGGINGFEVMFIGFELALIAGIVFALVRALSRRTQDAVPRFQSGAVSRRRLWPSLSIAIFALLCGIAFFFAFRPGYKASGFLHTDGRQERQQLQSYTATTELSQRAKSIQDLELIRRSLARAEKHFGPLRLSPEEVASRVEAMPQPDTDLIVVTYTDDHPERATWVLGTLMDAYREEFGDSMQIVMYPRPIAKARIAPQLFRSGFIAILAAALGSGGYLLIWRKMRRR